MNPTNPDPFAPRNSPDPFLQPNNPMDYNQPNMQSPVEPNNPEPLLPQINQVPENNAPIQPNPYNAVPNQNTLQPPVPNQNTLQPPVPELFQNPNAGYPQGMPQAENNPNQNFGYTPETIQNQNFNDAYPQHNANQLPPTIDPSQMFNPSTPYAPRQDLMGMPPEIPRSSNNTNNSSRGKLKVLLFAGGGLLLIILIIVGIIVIGGSSSKKNTPVVNNPEPNKPATVDNSIVATTNFDLKKGCEGSQISNASAYTGSSPHKIALFQESLLTPDSYSTSYVDITDPTWKVADKDYTSVQLLGCMKKTAEVATGKKCDLQDADKKTITIGLYTTTYKLTIYEAKTHKMLGSKDISGPITDCPILVSYNPADPKIYGDPDKGSVNDAIKEFVTK